MKIFKFVLLFLMLGSSQSSWADKWISNENGGTINYTVMSAGCQPDEEEPKYTPDTYPDLHCVPKPRDGYTCQEDDNYTCYENCRDNFVASGVATCHFKNATTQDRHCKPKTKCEYYKGTKVIKKCVTTQQCDNCREGYVSTGLFCEYAGTRDYARKSYQRVPPLSNNLTKRSTCELKPGWRARSLMKYGNDRPYIKCVCDNQNLSVTLSSSAVANGFELTATPVNFEKCGGNTNYTVSFKENNVQVASCTSSNSVTASCTATWFPSRGSHKVKAYVSTGSESSIDSNEITITK